MAEKVGTRGRVGAPAGRNGAGPARVRRNDHPAPEPPGPGGWEPELDAVVVVRACGARGRLGPTLASLAAQTYPARLTEVVVVADGGTPVRLPQVRPGNTRTVAAGPGRSGPQDAVRAVAESSPDAAVLWLEAGTEVGRTHVEAHMRWHHLADHLVVLSGAASPEPDGGPGPEAAASGDRDPSEGPGNAGHRGWRALAGSAWSARGGLLAECGGSGPAALVGGEDHLAYRLAQRGAVFVPEPAAGVRGPGGPRGDGREDGDARVHRLRLEDRVPLLRSRRAPRRREWQVPFAEVVVEVAGARFEAVSDTVERLLGGDAADVRITLVGPWRDVPSGRHAVLDDPDAEPRLVREAFRCESRVVFAEEAPRADPDVPFRLLVPPGAPVRPGAVDALAAAADACGAGLVRVRGAGALRLERTAAFARARRLGASGPDLDAAVAELWGEHEVDPAEVLEADRPGGEGPPADWHRRMRRAQRAADRHRAAADRWERRIRVLVRGFGVRLLLGRTARGARVQGP
ncbi:glycosyltransferase family 2 protein [Nocardiopsis tropica]|uniref:glycosyltransferase family 2 protein n=1 Tax=Nocardiopsis tropica TaxID=109330 RepID=UPI00360834E0